MPRMSQCPFPSGNGGHRGPSHFRTHRGGKRGERRVLPRRRANSGERGRVSFFPLEMLGGCLLMCFLVCEVRRKDSNINNGKKARGTISLPPDTPFRNRNLEANQ